MKTYYNSIFSQINHSDSSIKHLILPSFKCISKNSHNYSTQEQEQISEQEALTNVKYSSENIETDPNSYLVLSYLQEATSYQSVRQTITNIFIACIEKLLNSNKLIKKSATSDDLKSQDEFHLPNLQKSTFDDFGVYTYQDNGIQDSNMQVLLESIPTIYRYSTEEDMTKFNFLLIKLLNSFSKTSSNVSKGMSNLSSFKLTVDCIQNIFLIAKRCFIPLNSAKSLIQSMITTIFAISNDLSKLITNDRSILSQIPPYFGLLIHLTAEGADLLTDKEIFLVQNLWTTLVMNWDDLLTSFPEYSKDLKKLSLLIPSLVNPDESTKMIKTLCQMISYNRTNDSIAKSLVKIYKDMPIKEIYLMSQVDAVYLLTIGVLEKTRSKGGDFATFFDYFTVDYYRSFTNCLQCMVSSLFGFFMKHITKHSTPDQRRVAISATVTKVFRNYVGMNAEFSQLIDRISPLLFSNFQLCLFSSDVVASIIESMKEIEDKNPLRLPAFKLTVQNLIYQCVQVSPDLLFSLYNNYFITKLEISSDKITSVYSVVSLLPVDVRNKFLVNIMQMSTMYGSSQQLTIDQILKIKDPNERIMHLAFVVKTEKEFSLMTIRNASCETLNQAWSYVIMSQEVSTKQNFLLQHSACENIFLAVIIQDFLETVHLQQGLFATNYDKEMVEYHEAIFQFFDELISISLYFPQIEVVLYSLKHLMVIQHPAALSSLLRFALFLLSIIKISQTSPIIHEIAFNKLILVILKVISIATTPTILRYVNSKVIFLLNRLLKFFPSVFSFSLPIYKAIIKVDKRNNIIKKVNSSTLNLNDLFTSFSTNQQKFISSLQTNNKQASVEKLCNFLNYLLEQTYALFETYSSSPNEKYNFHYMKKTLSISRCNELIPCFWSFCPSSISSFEIILSIPNDKIILFIKPYFDQYPYQLAFESHLGQLFAKVKIDDLNLCDLLNPAQSIVLLKQEVLEHPTASTYLVKCLNRFEVDEILQYIPQLVQSVRFDTNGVLCDFLKDYCKKSSLFMHYLLWNILYEKCHTMNPFTDPLPLRLVELEGQILFNMTPEEKVHKDHEFALIDRFANISQQLIKFPVEQRKEELVKLLSSNPSLSDDLYVPSNPEYKIIDINARESRPLKSHEKVPLLVTFTVYDKDKLHNRQKMNFACIFKTNDDVRMDAMVIQLIDKFRRIFNDAGIDTYVLPYRVFATGEKRGVIECITHAKSRHEIGELYPNDLKSYYIHKYGQVGTETFDKAQHNFIKSMAPYSLICYLFAIKDRHNANIMIDDDGHIIHIDFGFIFGLSPGKNFNFERAPFKLAKEMIDLMGGSNTAKPFMDFVDLFTKCFIAVRACYDEIQTIAELMINAGFDCFQKDTFKQLRDRFFMDSLPSDLNATFQKLIWDSWGSITTSTYDKFQYLQNNIFFI